MLAVLVVVTHYLTFTVGSAFIHFTLPWMTTWMTMTAALQILYSSKISLFPSIWSMVLNNDLFFLLGAVVYQISRRFNKTRHSTAVIRAFVESSALYTLFDLALLIAFERASDADWVLIDTITPLIASLSSP
jgi:hypothetical protein